MAIMERFQVDVRSKPSPIEIYLLLWEMLFAEHNKQPFCPVFYAFNSHAQTVLCNSLNKLDEVLKPFSQFNREYLPAFDKGNFVCNLV